MKGKVKELDNIHLLTVASDWEQQLKGFLNDDGTLPLRTCAEYDAIDPSLLRAACHFYARYCLPTVELIQYLKELIGDQKAIEIGAGCGDLGRHLGIIMTDSFLQERPDIKFRLKAMEQPAIKYGRDVKSYEASDAIKRFKPDIVIGAWITQWIDPRAPDQGSGSPWGVKEELILHHVKRYIVIGADNVHRDKAIMKYPHQKIPAPFARSRRQDNFIWIWDGITTNQA